MKVTEECVGCGQCAAVCNQDAIVVARGKARIMESCINCKICMPYCPIKAIEDDK